MREIDADCGLDQIIRRPEVESTEGIYVMKFGGTSVGGARPIEIVTQIVDREIKEGKSIVIVASAMSGVTNRLVRICDDIINGDFRSIDREFRSILDMHYTAITELVLLPSIMEDVKGKMRALSTHFYKDVHDANRMTPERRDRIQSYGERMSIRLLEANLNEKNIPARAVDSINFLETDDSFGEAQPDLERTSVNARMLIYPLLRRGITPVVTGFLGRTADNRITTLGRGGSDFSASFIGRAINAKEVVICTDVDGVYASDPNKDPNAKIIHEMTMKEADNMAKAGAKVLHARTLEPLMSTRIFLRVKNTFNYDSPGTLVIPD